MRYTVRKSIVQVIGKIWMSAVTCAQEYTLSKYDLENATGENGNITRDSVERWVMLNTGDFQSIQDWSASLEVGNDTVEIPWQHGEESEMTFFDCMYPSEDCDCA